MIQVLVAGFRGAMGQKTVKMVQSHQDFALSAVFDPKITDLNPKSYNLPTNVQVLNTYDQLHAHVADVWVDFTNPSAVAANIEAAINAGIHPIVGTSGMDPANQERLIKLANAKHLGGLIAPNFGLSAVLLMKFAQAAAAYFPDAEIIEMHHQDKADAPSGTAIATAHKIAAGRTQKPLPTIDNDARGQRVDDVPIHAVRLPGYIAHEQVLFGGPGEALTIRQDSFDRQSFMQGVAVAISKVQTADELVVGLENFLCLCGQSFMSGFLINHQISNHD